MKRGGEGHFGPDAESVVGEGQLSVMMITKGISEMSSPLLLAQQSGFLRAGAWKWPPYTQDPIRRPQSIRTVRSHINLRLTVTDGRIQTVSCPSLPHSHVVQYLYLAYRITGILHHVVVITYSQSRRLVGLATQCNCKTMPVLGA